MTTELSPALLDVLTSRISELELRPMSEFRSLRGPAAEALAVAERLGAEELAQRAMLLQASFALREGRLAEGGQIAHRARSWAEAQGSEYVLARAHRELSIFFRLVGDIGDALTHGVQCLQHLPEWVPPAIRARHLVTLAVALDDSGSPDEGDRRYREGLAIANSIGDNELAVYIVNNMAYSAFEQEDEPLATRLATRMLELAADRGESLAANQLDTVARVAMMRGHYADVEDTLGPALDEGLLANESDAIAECVLTLAEARRLDGRFAAAQEALDRAVLECEARGLHGVRARVRQEQAALYAATGRFAEAYEEHRAFHSATSKLLNTQRDARARALQAVFEATEARRASEHFREMAHRDALTGLHNRRYVNERLPDLLLDAAERGRPLSVAIVDLDHFKRINDTLSHATGDTVLQQIGEILIEAAAGPAIAARMGGEEFLLIFPGVDADEALARCERLRLRIRAHAWEPITGRLPVTTSIGVTTISDGLGTPSALLSQADRNLYAAKRSGRDRVIGNGQSAGSMSTTTTFSER